MHVYTRDDPGNQPYHDRQEHDADGEPRKHVEHDLYPNDESNPWLLTLTGCRAISIILYGPVMRQSALGAVTNYPLLDAFLTMLWFFLWVIWIFILFRVIFDLFRDRQLSGWAKAGWLLFVIILPFLGVSSTSSRAAHPCTNATSGRPRPAKNSSARTYSRRPVRRQALIS